MKQIFSLAILVGLISTVVVLSACQPPKPAAAQVATLETMPLGNDIGQWQVIPGAGTKFIVTAPGASEVKVHYQPVNSINHHTTSWRVRRSTEMGNFRWLRTAPLTALLKQRSFLWI